MSHRAIVLSVGLFILISSILIVSTVVYVIDKKGVFEPHTQYQLIAKDAENIEKGMPVLFSGFEIGKVTDLGLHDNGEVLVTISIPEHNTKWLRSGAQFVLENPLIGKAKITLKSSMKNPPLEESIILRMQIKDGINEIITNIQPVVLELQNIVSNINTLTGSLSDQNASFQSSLKHIEHFSKKLTDSPNLLTSVTGNEKSAQELHEAISGLNVTLQKLQTLTQNIDGGVVELREDVISPLNNNLNEANLILKDIHSKLKDLNGTVKAISNSDKDIKYFKDEMKLLLDEMSELSDRVNSMISNEETENVQLP